MKGSEYDECLLTVVGAMTKTNVLPRTSTIHCFRGMTRMGFSKRMVKYLLGKCEGHDPEVPDKPVGVNSQVMEDSNTLDQSIYTKRQLWREWAMDIRRVFTPLGPCTNLSDRRDEEERLNVSRLPCESILRLLMHLADMNKHKKQCP